MKNSSKYFCNTECEHYPCHFEGQNCLFCFCPLYHFENCGGDYTIVDGKKDCSKCEIPHRPENYDLVIAKMKREYGWDIIYLKFDFPATRDTCMAVAHGNLYVWSKSRYWKQSPSASPFSAELREICKPVTRLERAMRGIPDFDLSLVGNVRELDD